MSQEKQPLRGLKFSSTSVPSEVVIDLSEKIKSMGGEYFNHLMSDVKFLIVGDRDTAKYNFSVQKRHDIHFLTPRSIRDLHIKWIEGEEVDVLNPAYGLQTFENCLICLSRMEGYDKDDITHKIENQGGSVTTSLTASNTVVVTTEKSGKRYTKALEWGIPTVHPEWVVDSVQRQAMLECRYYDISQLPREHIGNDSCDVWDKINPQAQHNPNLESLKVKRKSKPAIWSSIMGNVKPLVSLDRSNQWEEEEESFDCSVKRQKLGEEKSVSQLFLGLNFAFHGFNASQHNTLVKVVTSHSGDVTTLDDLVNTHLVVPSTLANDKVPVTEAKVVTEWFIERCLHYHKVVSDPWCYPLKSLGTKLNLKVCISGFIGVEQLHIVKLIELIGCQFCETLTKDRDMLVINLSTIGLTKQNTSNLFKYAHAELLDAPTSSVSLSSTKNKINACKAWDIPIVSLSYLWEIVGTGTLPDLFNLQWCVFAPRDADRPKSLMEYVKKLSNGVFETQANDRKSPSPRKKSGRARLIGRAQESQLNRTALEKSHPIGDEDEQDQTQVSYDLGRDESVYKLNRSTRNEVRRLNGELSETD